MRKYLFLAPLAALLIGAAPASPSPAERLAADRVRGHVEFLASDLLEGREAGTRGHQIAAAYVASEFRELGLTPFGGGGGWYQQANFRTATLAEAPTVTLVRGGKPEALVSGKDFGLRPNLVRQSISVDAPLVFVGHGISAPSLGIDDYSGLDVRGKIVIALSGAGPSLPSDIAAHLSSRKDDAAAAHGAIGMIEIGEDSQSGRNSEIARRVRPLVGWVGTDGVTGGSVAPLQADLAISTALATRLFDGAPKSFAAVRAEGARGKIAGFPLAARLRVRAKSDWRQTTSPNVIGLLPGSDPALAGEYIVIMGHLDHLGINPSAKPGQDRIYNGALDNAAGVATMIEAARSFVESGQHPRRSILFIATTGEEKGLLGADYFAAHPSVPIDRIVGAVNLDMPLLLYDFTDVIAFGSEHSTMDQSVAPAAASMGVALSPDPMPEQSLFVRSDHYPLVRRGVPSIFLMTGYANGGQKNWTEFLGGNYHQVSDDLSQDIHWAAAARFAELNYRIARALANAPSRPQWYRGDFFGNSFGPGQPKAPHPPGNQPRKP